MTDLCESLKDWWDGIKCGRFNHSGNMDDLLKYIENIY